MKIKEIVAALEQCAPLPLQDDFDNAGLQVGLTETDVTGALLCLDVTEAVIDEAVAKGCNLVVSHHPLLFKPLKRLTGKSYIERCVMKAVQQGITLYAAHTNLDNAPQGVNFKIAQKMGLSHVEILEPRENSLLKLVTFVPVAHADGLREALFAAGCGCIGDYDACSYNLQGEGTFRAGEGTHPFCGQQGEMHSEPETRIETILPAYKKSAVEQALITAHPYEEPAYDFYPLANSWYGAGSGVTGEFDNPRSAGEFLAQIKQTFEVGCVLHNRFEGPIKKVALCGGAGAFLLPQAIAADADAFVTGEIRYHDYFGHDSEILMAAIGHYESEQFTREIFYDLLRSRFPALRIETTQLNTNPIQYL